MKLFFVLSVTLALSLADEIETNPQAVEDLETSASVIAPRSQDYNLPIANNYNNVPNSVAPKLWNPPSNYDSVKTAVPSASVRNYYASESNYNQPESGYSNQYNNNYNQNNQNSWNNPQPSQPSNNWSQNNGWNNQQNPQNNVWNNQQKPQNSGWNNQQKPQDNGWNNQQNAWNQQNSWNQQGSSQNVGAQNNWNKPQNGGSQNSWNKPQNSGSQNNWNAGNNQNNLNQNVPSSSSTTTPVPVIKNEQILGDNGSYKYEYEIADGTHVSEEGYATNVNNEESIVKKGFYSFTGADGKVYTVTYWADDTGFHAEGDHLPKPHPIPPAIQASIDQNAKEEAAKAEEEKKKQQQQQQQQQQQNIYYPQGQEPPKPLAPQQPIQPTPQPVYPQQVYYPPQQTYYPPQDNYYSPQSYGK